MGTAGRRRRLLEAPFKFGPALGRLVADIVEGGRTPDLFRMDRPTLAGDTPSATAPISR